MINWLTTALIKYKGKRSNNSALKLIIPGNPQDIQLSQLGHPGFGAHPMFKKIGVLNTRTPIEKIKIPRNRVINSLAKLGFNNFFIFNSVTF